MTSSILTVECGHAHPDVIAIVGDLVKHHILFRKHLLQPLQSPPCFVEYIWLTITSIKAIREFGICENVREIAVGHQQVIGSVGGGGGILKIVGCVVPASNHIHIGAVGYACRFSIQHISIARVAAIVEIWIESCALLAHVPQAEIGGAFVHININFEFWRTNAACLQIVSSWLLKIGEVQTIGLGEWTVLTEWFSCGTFRYRLA